MTPEGTEVRTWIFESWWGCTSAHDGVFIGVGSVDRMGAELTALPLAVQAPQVAPETPWFSWANALACH